MKDKLTHVTDAETIEAIERNGFGDPTPFAQTAAGYWVPTDVLEQYRERQRAALTDGGDHGGK